MAPAGAEHCSVLAEVECRLTSAGAVASRPATAVATETHNSRKKPAEILVWFIIALPPLSWFSSLMLSAYPEEDKAIGRTGPSRSWP